MPPPLRPSLVNREPETSCRNEFIACSQSHGHTIILRSFLALGVAALLPMTLIAPLSIFGGLSKTTLAERFPTLSLRSQIGRRKGNFSGLSVMFLLKMPLHEGYPGRQTDETRLFRRLWKRSLSSKLSFKLTS